MCTQPLFSSDCIEEKEWAGTFYDSGFWLVSRDEKMHVGGTIQCDERFFLNVTDAHSTFLIRRARLYLTGTLEEMFGYMVMARWDRQVPALHFAWLETLEPASLRFRVGLFKEPFSLEVLYADMYWDFDERSLGSINYLQQEDIGAMLFGKIWDDRLEYAVGVFNGRGRELDNNQNKECVARIVVTPFTTEPFKRFFVGLSISNGRVKEELTHGFHTGSDTRFFIWNNTPGNPVTTNSDRFRYGGDIEWLSGPRSLRAEFLHIDLGRIRNDFVSAPFSGYSWYVEGGYILTGEEKPRNRPVIPYENFDLKCGHGLGAWELVGRYEFFNATKRALDVGLATGANEAQGWTAGVNWYLNPYLAFKMDVQHLLFNRTIHWKNRAFDHETVLLGRFQGEF
ncbi:MAG: hypothetical protein H0X51_07950 [Parachlamydiaceae bacterium]|nr:hypothetical protein [Parachlamydiaceae bacterium]